MDNLVKIENGQAVVSSRDIAKNFGKRHDHVMRDVKSLMEGLPNFGDTPNLFFKATYINEQNRTNKNTLSI